MKMVLIEALCFGLPILSFDCHTGPREILERCGIDLVPEQDTSALADLLLALMNDPAKRQALSDLARASQARAEVSHAQASELSG